jgi:cytochrome c-type biogenesis protein CcmH
MVAQAGVDPASVVGPPANPPPPADQVQALTRAVASKIRCPVCQGLSVADSPSESARAMKDEVQALVAQGYAEDQIIDYFEASYGEFIRLDPKVEGWNVLVWVLPAALLLGGGAWVAWNLRAPRIRPVLPTVDPVLQPWVDRVLADVGNPDA